MDPGVGANIAQRLAYEKHLLEEERFMIEALNKVKTERHGLQIERMHLISMLDAALKEGKPAPGHEGKFIPESNPAPAPSLTSEFDLPTLDDVNNEVELNLTVPTHPFYEPLPDEFEELDNEDDYEIEIGMLMNPGQKKFY